MTKETFKLHDRVDIANFSDEIIHYFNTTKRDIFLIKGPSGVGKTWFISELEQVLYDTKTVYEFLRGDDFGEEQQLGDKRYWIINGGLIAKRMADSAINFDDVKFIYEGNDDNHLVGTIPWIKGTFGWSFICTTPDNFRAINRAKALDFMRNRNVDDNDQWVQHWFNKASLRNHEIEDYFNKKEAEFAKHYGEPAFRIVLTGTLDTNDLSGWHNS